jgi:hypothetical protein
VTLDTSISWCWSVASFQPHAVRGGQRRQAMASCATILCSTCNLRLVVLRKHHVESFGHELPLHQASFRYLADCSQAACRSGSSGTRPSRCGLASSCHPLHFRCSALRFGRRAFVEELPQGPDLAGSLTLGRGLHHALAALDGGDEWPAVQGRSIVVYVVGVCYAFAGIRRASGQFR